jgi:hypothetical protein
LFDKHEQRLEILRLQPDRRAFPQQATFDRVEPKRAESKTGLELLAHHRLEQSRESLSAVLKTLNRRSTDDSPAFGQ